MAINAISTAVRNAMCDAFVDAMDTGTTDTGGAPNIFNAAFALLLAEPLFGDPAFGPAAVGIATVNAVTDDPSANNSGTAAVCRFEDRDNATVADGSVSTSGADINLNTLTITGGDIVAITGGTVTMPAS